MFHAVRAAFTALVILLVILLPVTATADPCIWLAGKDTISLVRSNAIALTIPIENAHVLGMNGQDCGVWVADKKQLRHFDGTGSLLAQVDLTTLDKTFNEPDQLLVDPYDDSVWLAEKKVLLHLSAGGQPIGSLTTPGPVRSAFLAIDQSVWILGNKQLWHYDAHGTQLATLDLQKMVDAEPKMLIVDSLGGVLWLAGEKQLTQINLNQPNGPARRITLTDKPAALTLNPLTGEVWLAAARTLLSYARDGSALRTIDLRANNIKEIDGLVFDPTGRVLWAMTDNAVSLFSERGEFMQTLPMRERVQALGVPAFLLTPVLSLIRPPHDALTNNPQPIISYGYDALCNNQSCGFAQNYFSSYSLTATLDQKPIGPFVFDAGIGQAGYALPARLPDGRHALAAQATDRFGHVSAMANDLFTVDTVAPKFLSLSPAEGSVATVPNVLLQGIVDDATAIVIVEGAGQIMNTTIGGTMLNFSYPVILAPGLNIFTLSALDKAANSSSVKLHLTYSAISVAVTSPANGATVDADSVLVAGTFQGPANTGIVVNGVVAAQEGNRFYAQVPLQVGANTLTVTATTAAGVTASRIVNVVGTGPGPIQVVPSPAGGMAPLTVDFAIQNNTANAIVKIEADFNGDGVADFTATDPAAPVQFTYTVPGIYQARIKITDSQNKVVDKIVMIVAQDPAQIDQMLKAQWDGMNSALIRGDKAMALTYLNAQARDKYGPIFDALLPKMPVIIGSYSAAKGISITEDIGEYAINRTIDSVNSLFLIYFLRDVDGVWRLDSM